MSQLNLSVSVKTLLKNADEAKVVEIIGGINEKLETGKYEKVKHDVIGILTQKKPKINAQTRRTYKDFVKIMRSIIVLTMKQPNTELLRRVNNFEKRHLLAD